LFWKIVKLEENVNQRLSFRACGWWTVPMTTVSEGALPIEDWNAADLQRGVNQIISQCELDAQKVSEEIHGLDDNLRVIERLHSRHMIDYQGRVKDIWLECLLTAILKQEYHDSERIVRDRVRLDARGACQVDDKSFYELAEAYLEVVRRFSSA
jgi:hypothetical protein